MPIAHRSMKLWYQSYVDDELGGIYLDRLEAHLDALRDEHCTVDVHRLTPPDSYAHPIVEFRCARQVVKNAVQAERQGYDAFVVGHIQDSGLWEARAVVDIPVLGLGESVFLHACTLGMKIGVVTINPRFIPGFYHQIRKYALENRVTGVHAMRFESDFQPGDFMRGFESPETYEAVKAAFIRQAQPLVVGGVEVIIPGGGIPMLLFSEENNFNVDGAPVVNGIPIVLKAAEMAVQLRRLNGTTISRTADFAKPPPEIIQEFLDN